MIEASDRIASALAPVTAPRRRGTADKLSETGKAVLQRFIDFIDRTNELLGRAVAWLALLLVLLVAMIVVLRYGFQVGSIALQELVMYLNALLFSLGAAYTLKHQGHVRVDVFYGRLSDRGKRVVDLAGCLLLLCPTMLFILLTSWDYVSLSWRIREGSAESSGLQAIYLLKTTILLLAGLLLLQGLAEFTRTYLGLRAGDSRGSTS